jgi:hypothetical protein
MSKIRVIVCCAASLSLTEITHCSSIALPQRTAVITRSFPVMRLEEHDAPHPFYWSSNSVRTLFSS